MLANHKMIYIDGYNFRNQSNQLSQSSRKKIFLNTLIYFEERTGYSIIITKYLSVILIEVINYDDKNVGTLSSKSRTLRSHGSHFFAIAGTETENFVELSGSNFVSNL